MTLAASNGGMNSEPEQPIVESSFDPVESQPADDSARRASLRDNGGNVDGVTKWLSQLRGSWEDELADAALEEWPARADEHDVKQPDLHGKLRNICRLQDDLNILNDDISHSTEVIHEPSSADHKALDESIASQVLDVQREDTPNHSPDAICRQTSSDTRALAESIASQVLDVLPSPSMNSIRQKFGRLFSRSNSVADTTAADIRRQQYRAKTLAQAHEKNILKLNAQMKKVHVNMKDELSKWERWAMESLATVGRTYYETKRLHLGSLLEVEVHLVDFYRKIEGCYQLKLKNTEVSNDPISHVLFREDGSVVPVDEVDFPSSIVQMKQSCAGMENVIEHLTEQYQEMQKAAMRTETNDERRLKLGNILRKCLMDAAQFNFQSSSFHYHEPDRVFQAAFNRLMLDERQREGQLIKHWMTLLRDTLRSPNRRVTSEAIEAFLDYLVKFLFKQYDLDSFADHLDKPLRLCIDRMVFPRIRRTTHRLRSSLEREKDEVFRCKTRWLWRVSQEQLGIIAEFRSPIEYDLAAPPPGMMSSPSGCSRSRTPSPSPPSSTSMRSPLFVSSQQSSLCPLPEDFPFIEPIRWLSRLDTECVPADMLFYLVQTITEVQTSCRNYANKTDAVIDADTLFPVVVWTVVHASAGNIHQRLGHIIRHISDQQRNFGEVGFCLSLVEASVAHILQLKPSKFGLDDNLDQDLAPTAAIAATSAVSPEVAEQSNQEADAAKNTII